jgi:hypothetical protein
MSAKPAAIPAPPTPVPAAVPATQYERFLAALPETFRDECRSKLDGSGLAANHPVFHALAELYEKERQKPARNFIQEATLHADHATKLLQDFEKVPQAILAQIEPQLLGLVSALNGPLQKLETLSTATPPIAQPVLATVANEPSPNLNDKSEQSKHDKKGGEIWHRVGQFFRIAGSTVSNPVAWVVTGSISAAVAVMIFSLGAAHLSHSYEAAYQDRVAHMEADSTSDTIALNRLLVAGISLKVERSPDANAWYLILPGAHKATPPVNSPEGLAVEVWP